MYYFFPIITVGFIKYSYYILRFLFNLLTYVLSMDKL